MKKCILVLMLLFSLWGTSSAQKVSIANLKLLNNELTFDISWGANGRTAPWSDSAWIFVDYYDMPSGEMLRMPVGTAERTAGAGWGSSATVSVNSGNNSGFYVIGQAKGQGAGTVTVKLTPAAGLTLARPCVYATDYPPLVVYELSGADNVVKLKGTEPYCGVLANSAGTVSFPVSTSSFTLGAGYKVQGVTDATGNEGLIKCGASAFPVITTQPFSQAVLSGMPFNLTVGATGVQMSYRWLQDGKTVGGNTAVYSATAVQAASTYQVLLYNPIDCNTFSQTVKITTLSKESGCPGYMAGTIGASPQQTCGVYAAGQIGASTPNMCGAYFAGAIGAGQSSCTAFVAGAIGFAPVCAAFHAGTVGFAPVCAAFQAGAIGR